MSTLIILLLPILYQCLQKHLGICRYDKRTDAELFIFDDQTGSDGPKAAAKGTPVVPEKPHFEHGQETVLFPGVNAPMPVRADYALWVSVTC